LQKNFRTTLDCDFGSAVFLRHVQPVLLIRTMIFYE